MIIDFDKIIPSSIMGFKGGVGELVTQNYADGDCKIMHSILRPGASTGSHLHENNCEVILVLSGTLTFYYDDEVETVKAGQVHYCPRGHHHYMKNLTTEDVVYFAIVPELRESKS